MDRFDILEGYYVFGMLWHSGQFSETYRYLGRCSRAGYSPGLSAQQGKLTTEGSRAVYRALCLRHGV